MKGIQSNNVDLILICEENSFLTLRTFEFNNLTIIEMQLYMFK